MSKKEKIKSLKKTVKDLRAQVKKLKLASAKSKIGKSKTGSTKPDAPAPLPIAKIARAPSAAPDGKSLAARIADQR